MQDISHSEIRIQITEIFSFKKGLCKESDAVFGIALSVLSSNELASCT